MSNRSLSAPPVIENATALFAAVASASVPDSAVTSVVFSATACVEDVSHTGALSFWSTRLTVKAWATGCAPSLAVTSTAKAGLLAGLGSPAPT